MTEFEARAKSHVKRVTDILRWALPVQVTWCLLAMRSWQASLAHLYRRLRQSGRCLTGGLRPTSDRSAATSSSRSIETSAEHASIEFAAPDVSERLQRLIAGWRGAERGQPISALHDECRSAVGPGGTHLLPAKVLTIVALDEAALRQAIRRSLGIGSATEVRFRVRPVGRFDAAMVPVGPIGSPPDRWLLAVDDELDVADQVALYAHAIGSPAPNTTAAASGSTKMLKSAAGVTLPKRAAPPIRTIRPICSLISGRAAPPSRRS